MVRVDPDAYDVLLKESGARPMDFTGRPMRGFLYVGGPGVATARALGKWVSRAVAFAGSLPPKPSRTARR
jgi:hypothetical protein